MSEPTPTTTMASPIQLPDAEALYSTLREKLLPLRQPHTQIAGITSGGAWLAQRLHLPENQSLALRKNEDDTFSLALRPTSPA